MSQLRKKLADFILAVEHRASQWLAAAHDGIRATGFTWPLAKSPARCGAELFVALSLSVYFFYLVRTQSAIKVNGNLYPSYTFAYMIDNKIHRGDLTPENWRTRLLAPATTGLFLNTQYKDFDTLMTTCGSFPELCRSQKFESTFGWYHTTWLLLLFVTLIFLRPDALFIMLGVFAGLMYNLTAPAGQYYLPWDMPALFFFTLACLLFERGWILFLMPLLILGSLYKETILCCSLFILLGSHWNWPKRITAFLATVLAAVGMNHLLMAHYGVSAPLSALNGARKFSDLFEHTLLAKNLGLLFTPHLNHVIFANAGALLLLLLLPWRSRRDVLFKLVMVVFAAGQFLYGLIDEVRIWYEVLPLGWILISEALTRSRPATQKTPTRAASLFQGSHRLALSGGAALTLGIFIVLKFNPSPAEATAKVIKPIPQALLAAANSGDPTAQFKLAMVFATERQDFITAAEWFRQSASRGCLPAKYNLGLTYWHGLGGASDQVEGLRLLREAAQEGFGEAQTTLGKLYQGADGIDTDFVEAYKWLKIAGLQRGTQTSAQLQACAARMTPEQIAAAEQQVKIFLAPK